MPVKLITAAEVEPVSLEEFKAHLRAEGLPELPDLTIKLQAAREKLESGTETDRAFIASTWELYLDHWPCWSCGSCFCPCQRSAGRRFEQYHGPHENHDRILVPKGQLRSVASIKYTDSNGVETPWPTSEYE